MAFKSRYDGWCKGCGRRILVNDMLEKFSGGGWKHADCGLFKGRKLRKGAHIMTPGRGNVRLITGAQGR